MNYQVTVILTGQSRKDFTDFGNLNSAKDFARKVCLEGVLFTDPNGDGGVYYPPHRVQLIDIKEQIEEQP